MAITTTNLGVLGLPPAWPVLRISEKTGTAGKNYLVINLDAGAAMLSAAGGVLVTIQPGGYRQLGGPITNRTRTPVLVLEES